MDKSAIERAALILAPRAVAEFVGRVAELEHLDRVLVPGAAGGD